MLLQDKRDVASAYQAHGTPAAVVVSPDGTVGSRLALGADAILRLVARTAKAPVSLPSRQSAKLRPGDPAPPLELPDLDGKFVRLQEFRGRSVALLFWNPECGFCNSMLPVLRRWEEDRPTDAPELLVVSGGTVSVNRAMGVRSRVVLDTGFAAGRAFGATGTPSAVLVDGDGHVASVIGVGAETRSWRCWVAAPVRCPRLGVAS